MCFLAINCDLIKIIAVLALVGTVLYYRDRKRKDVKLSEAEEELILPDTSPKEKEKPPIQDFSNIDEFEENNADIDTPNKSEENNTDIDIPNKSEENNIQDQTWVDIDILNEPEENNTDNESEKDNAYNELEENNTDNESEEYNTDNESEENNTWIIVKINDKQASF